MHVGALQNAYAGGLKAKLLQASRILWCHYHCFVSYHRAILATNC